MYTTHNIPYLWIFCIRLSKSLSNLVCIKLYRFFFFNENGRLLQHSVKQKYSNQHTNLPYRWNTYTKCPKVLPCCFLIFIHYTCIIWSADDIFTSYWFSFQLRIAYLTLHIWGGGGGVSIPHQTPSWNVSTLIIRIVKVQKISFVHLIYIVSQVQRIKISPNSQP